MLKNIHRYCTSKIVKALGRSTLGFIFLASQVTLGNECTPVSSQMNHTVVAGETLGEILFGYNISPLWGPGRYVDITAKTNSITPGTKLFPGQVLRIPMRCQEHMVRVPSSEPVPVATEAAAPAAIAPAAAPSAVSSSPENNQESSTLSMDLTGKYSAFHGRDNSNDTEARLISRFDPGARLTWTQTWDSKVQSFIFFDFQNVSLASEKSGLPLKNADISKSGFGFGARYALTERVKLGGTIAQLPQIFYQGIVATPGLEFSVVPIWTVTPEASYLIAKGKKLSLSADVGATFYGSEAYAEYRIHSGWGFQGGLSVKHELANGSEFRCAGFYGERRQNTSVLELDEKFTGLSCGFGWKL